MSLIFLAKSSHGEDNAQDNAGHEHKLPSLFDRGEGDFRECRIVACEFEEFPEKNLKLRSWYRLSWTLRLSPFEANFTSPSHFGWWFTGIMTAIDTFQRSTKKTGDQLNQFAGWFRWGVGGLAALLIPATVWFGYHLYAQHRFRHWYYDANRREEDIQ